MPFHNVGKTPHLVTVLKKVGAKGTTYELRWRVRGEDDSQGGYKDPGPACDMAQHLHGLLVAGKTEGLPIGREARRRRATARPSTMSVRTLSDVFEAYVIDRVASGSLKSDSVKGYRATWFGYVVADLQDGERHIRLDDFNADNLTLENFKLWHELLRKKPKTRGKGTLSDGSIVAAQRVLNAVVQFGVDQDWIRKNYARLIPKKVVRERDIEYFESVEEFIPVARRVVAWARMPIVFTAFTGIRYGELAGLHGEDFDMQGMRMRLFRQFDSENNASTLKTTESESWVEIHPNLFKLLEGYFGEFPERAQGENLAFPAPRYGHHLGDKALNSALKSACREAGITRNITFHGLRHSAATWLADANIPPHQIQKLLRHADAKTTARYMHVSARARKNAVEAMPVPVMDVIDFI